MATSLDSLVIEIRARDEQFAAALKAVEARLSSFEHKVTASTKRVEASFKSMGAAVSRIQGMFATLSSAIALGGLTSMAKDALDAAGNLVDTADRIGITVEALQELQFAATQSGVSVEGFTQSMTIFTRRLSEAASGTGDAAKALKALSLDAKALAQDPARALTVIAEKIAEIPSQARKLELVNDLFGRGSAAMVNMLQVGGPALEALMQKLRDMGGVMTDETARAAEELGDRFDAATQAIGTQFKTALIEIAPLLVKVAEHIASAAKEARGFLTSIGNFSDIPKRMQLDLINRNIATLEKNLQTTDFSGGLFRQGPEDAAKMQKRLAELREEAKRLSGELVNFNNVVSGSSSPASKKFTQDLGDLGGEMTEQQKKYDKLIQSTQEHADTLNLSGAALADYAATAALADGATQEQAAALRAAVLADENAKASKEAHTEAVRKNAEAEKKAEQLRKDIEEDRIKREEFLNDLIRKHNVEQQEAAQRNAESARQMQNENAALEEEGQLLRASLGPKDDLRALERAIAEARIDRQIATERAKAEEDGLTAAEENNLATKEQLLKANLAYTASVNAQRDALAGAALTTSDLETFTEGLLSGTQDLGSMFEDMGQAMGSRMIKGVLFGKGQDEQAIIGNFNQLLGVDAAGLFGSQGMNLGQTLIGGITSAFGGSEVTQATGGLFDNVVAGGSSTAASAGTSLGSIFGGAMAGAAGMALGKGLSSMMGIGGSTSSKLGGNIGGAVGAIAGGIVGSVVPVIGTMLGAAVGGALGSIGGSLIGSLFAHTPTKGSQIRKGIKDFLKDIKVSFASEIDETDYFFEETKKLAKKMFGGDDGKDFLKASKVLLEDTIGPELSKQLQALGAFLTADQAQKLGKSVEQTGTTFGNMLLDNLGVDPEVIGGAMDEIIQKANITFPHVAEKLTSLFDKGKISAEFYTDTIAGAVELFHSELPDAINVSAIALKAFNEEGVFDIEKFNKDMEAATSTFNIIVQSFIDVIKNSKPGEDIGDALGKQIMIGIRDAAIDAYLTKFFTEELFKDIDLSDGLGADELALINTRAGLAKEGVDALKKSFGDLGDDAEDEGDKAANAIDNVAKAFERVRDLARQRYELRLDVMGDLASIGMGSDVDVATARYEGGKGRLAALGARTRTDFTDMELEEGLSAIRDMRAATVARFQAEEAAANEALQNRIKGIQDYYNTERDHVQERAQRAQNDSDDRIEALQKEQAQVQELFQSRLDALQTELQLAEEFRQLAESLQQTINQLVQSASPFTKPEQFAAFGRQAEELRQQIAVAPKERQAELMQQLSGVLSTQLGLGKEILDPTAFGNLFNEIVGELEGMKDQATAEGNRVENLQAEIASTTAQMEVQLRRIDGQIEAERKEAEAAQKRFEEQADALSKQEQAAIAHAEQETAAYIDRLRLEAAQEIRNLGVIEDQILFALQERAAKDVDFNQEQLNVLNSINGGIGTLTGQFITFFNRATTPPETTVTANVEVDVSVTATSEDAIIDAIARNIRAGGKVRAAIRGVG